MDTPTTQLNETEIALLNEAKALAKQCGAFIEKLRGHNALVTFDEKSALPSTHLDDYWIGLGATDMQRGFRALILGIAQPTTF